MRDQAAEVAKSPMWWAMKEARGEKTVTSMPRSSISRSWLVSSDSRIWSSLMTGPAGSGARTGSVSAAVWASRQCPSGAGAVV